MLGLILSIGLCVYPIQADNFPCSKITKFIIANEIQHISILWGTFGDDNHCIEGILPHIKSVYIHPTNETCRRKQCYQGEIWRNYDASDYNNLVTNHRSKWKVKFKKRLDNILQFTEQYPDIKWLYSTGLEDNYTDKTYAIIYRLVNRRLKNAKKIYRNPVDYRNCSGLCEIHSQRNPCKNGSCIYSNDGTGISGVDTDYAGSVTTVQRARAELSRSKSYLWWGKSQGLIGKWVRPADRRFRFTRADSRIIKKVYHD